MLNGSQDIAFATLKGNYFIINGSFKKKKKKKKNKKKKKKNTGLLIFHIENIYNVKCFMTLHKSVSKVFEAFNFHKKGHNSGNIWCLRVVLTIMHPQHFIIARPIYKL